MFFKQATTAKASTSIHSPSAIFLHNAGYTSRCQKEKRHLHSFVWIGTLPAILHSMITIHRIGVPWVKDMGSEIVSITKQSHYSVFPLVDTYYIYHYLPERRVVLLQATMIQL